MLAPGFLSGSAPATTKCEAYAPPQLVKGHPVTGALTRVFTGGAGTVVKAVPGSGKSTAIVTMIAHLLASQGDIVGFDDNRMPSRPLSIVVACPTRMQAIHIALALHAELPPNIVRLRMAGDLGDVPAELLGDREPALDGAPHLGLVDVRTVESCRQATPKCDIMFFDEAAQAMYAFVVHAAGNAVQVVLVGDTGQLPPVSIIPTELFDKWGATPHHPATSVAEKQEAEEIEKGLAAPERIWATWTLDGSYRLGPTSAHIISPLYGFEVKSLRSDCSVAGRAEVEVVKIDPVDDHNSPKLLGTAVERVKALVGQPMTLVDGTTRAVEPKDIAVVLSRNTQVSQVNALLEQAGIDGVTVGTANEIQGSEFPAVVSVDPFAGVSSVQERDGHPGLTCVMASRHVAHLTWIMEENWADRVALVAKDEHRQMAIEVRERLEAI